MKLSLKLIIAGVALFAGLSSAHAKNLAVVLDSNGAAVRTASGDCLRTEWEDGMDSCKGGIIGKYARGAQSVYFNFGSSALSMDGKKTLNALAASIKSKNDVMGVRIAGFADRIGSAAANEKLSKKRADKVRRYLLAKGVANAKVVETRWFGDSVAATNCEKGLSKTKLVACLQPDRRVDIEIDFAKK